MGHLRRMLVPMLVVLPILVGCAGPTEQTPAPTPAVSGSVPGSAAAALCSAWGCEQDARFVATSAFIAARTGHVGLVLRDRVTGAVWRAGEPDLAMWASSTPKLALTVALKEQAAAGNLTLTAADQRDIDAMLAVSDNDAATELWNRYANGTAIMNTWRTSYGMSSAGYVAGFDRHWGFVKCTPQDLANLMGYILDKADPAIRKYIVDRMRTVGPPQQWGVWGAGPALRPGVKDGWSAEEDNSGTLHWVTSTVGFAGPDERYVVSAMYDQVPGNDTKEIGVHVLTDLVATLFGAPVPAPATVPLED